LECSIAVLAGESLVSNERWIPRCAFEALLCTFGPLKKIAFVDQSPGCVGARNDSRIWFGFNSHGPLVQRKEATIAC
jgi:hypothetical protein